MSIIPIHNLSQAETSLDFEVQLWRKEVNKYDASTPHRHGYFEVLVFTKGGGVHEIDFQHYPVKGNAIHFVAGNQVHEVRRKPGSDGFSLLFAQEFLPPNYHLKEFDFYQDTTNPILNLSTQEFKGILPLLSEIRDEYFTENSQKREILQSLLQVFLLKALRLYKQKSLDQGRQAKADGHELKQKIELTINEHYKEHWRASDYANALNMSVGNLNSLSKTHFSRSTESLIQERIIVEAKRLLVYTSQPVKEICYELNFEDPAYFNRFFKKKTGLTPLEYRSAINA